MTTKGKIAKAAPVVQTKAEAAAAAAARTLGASIAKAVVASYVAIDGEIVKLKGDLETAARGQAVAVYEAFKAQFKAKITGEYWDANLKEPVAAEIVAAGYKVDAKGVCMKARSLGSELKAAALAIADGFRGPLEAETTLKAYVSACRSHNYAAGLMTAPPAKDPKPAASEGGTVPAGSNSGEPIAPVIDYMQAALLLTCDDQSTAARLVKACEEEETFDRLAAFLQELLTPAKGRRLK